LGKADVDILIAGCGTGQDTVELAQRLPRARLLAVDLSLTSLAYAKRMAREAGCANIDFAQADILKLAAVERQFDVIVAGGVLHHLADPLTGWQVLLSRLRPGGLMRFGLYSALARRDVAAARAFVAERGYGRTAADIRRCRQDLMALADDAVIKNVVRSRDFFTLSGCRDLLFHVQEHHFTLPKVKQLLAQTGLKVVGVDIRSDVRQNYRKRFPGDPSMTDLDLWHAFESENPDTFVGMYQFWAQRDGAMAADAAVQG
jgi:SAM-dependent methyltransferase